MSTRRRSSYATRTDPRLAARYRGSRAGARAFTLIELLVVVAIIALLISRLLPSLQGAREQARMAVCGSNMKNFSLGLNLYVNDNEDWIPGLNTSGTVLSALFTVVDANPAVLDRPQVPIQTFDWMTPLMPGQLPSDYAQRFKYLLSKFRCPSQGYNSAVYSYANSVKLPEIKKLAPWPAISYLMPVHFQYVGQSQKGTVIGYMEAGAGGVSYPIYALGASSKWEVLAQDFWPRIDRIGQPARKVFAADGTRYLPDTLQLDFDPSLKVNTFGSFCSAGAWWCGDTSYGVASGSGRWDSGTVPLGSPSNGNNLALSYRHGTTLSESPTAAKGNRGLIQAQFFDGHVQKLNDRQSRNINLWYPTGALIKKPNEGLTTTTDEMIVD